MNTLDKPAPHSACLQLYPVQSEEVRRYAEVEGLHVDYVLSTLIEFALERMPPMKYVNV